MINVVIVEDCPLYCEGIRSWLNEEQYVMVRDQTGDWNTYQKIAREVREFITVTSMLWINTHTGIETFTSFHKNHPSISVYCMNLRNNGLHVFKLFESEIKGYISRQATKEEFIFGLNEIIKGRLYISTEQGISRKSPPDGTRIDHDIPFVSLTRREIEILDLISLGFSDKEIGNKINISKRTVDGYRHNLLVKFGARNSPQLVKYAIAGNYISGNTDSDGS
jgi:DNA-binding NarL/FixJ family response regulator